MLIFFVYIVHTHTYTWILSQTVSHTCLTLYTHHKQKPFNKSLYFSVKLLILGSRFWVIHVLYIQYIYIYAKIEDKTGAGKGWFWHGIQSKMKSFIYSNYTTHVPILTAKTTVGIEPHAHTHSQPTTAAAQFAFNNC